MPFFDSQVKHLDAKTILCSNCLGACKGCWNFPHPDLSLRSGRPSPKMGEGRFSPILGEMPEGQRGWIQNQYLSAPF